MKCSRRKKKSTLFMAHLFPLPDYLLGNPHHQITQGTHLPRAIKCWKARFSSTQICSDTCALHTNLGSDHGTLERGHFDRKGSSVCQECQPGAQFLFLPNQHSFSFLYLQDQLHIKAGWGGAVVFFILAKPNWLHHDTSRVHTEPWKRYERCEHLSVNKMHSTTGRSTGLSPALLST